MSTPRPDSAEGWVRLGVALIETGQTRSAPRCFAEAARLEPRNAQHRARLGKVLLSLRQYDAAHEALRLACALDPGSAQWQTLLGYVLREQNDVDGALAAYARARQAEPENLNCAVAEALLLPPIYRDASDLDRWRSRFEQGLDRLHAELPSHPSWPAQVLGLEWENFSLAHQGRDDLSLQTLYAEFVAKLLAGALPRLQDNVPRAQSRSGRIRVGFLSSELRTCTIGNYFGSWILGLPRDRFELRGYFTGSIRDELTAKIAQACEAFESLPGGVDTVAARVRADALDVLIYPDIGLTTQSHLLANLRLAPIQCAAWGHPVTTGSRYIDYFFSCSEMEPPSADEHYRESLLLLPGLGVRYERPPVAAMRSRSAFGLPEDARLYICPNRLHKILPDWDDVVLDVVTKDPQATVVFFDTAAPGQRQAFVDRLQRAMEERGLPPKRQLKFLPMLPQPEFRDALAVADVMLDAPNFSAGSSALDALAVGLPIVAHEGSFMRGRQSAAMLRMIGVPELVVQSPGSCADLAVRIASDRDYRSSLSERIRSGLPRLFGRGEPVAALAAALVDLVSRREARA
jgi:protein O-GlcNAc transferase